MEEKEKLKQEEPDNGVEEVAEDEPPGREEEEMKNSEKTPWLSPGLKRILVGAGGSAITVVQLILIIMFITYFFA